MTGKLKQFVKSDEAVAPVELLLMLETIASRINSALAPEINAGGGTGTGVSASSCQTKFTPV